MSDEPRIYTEGRRTRIDIRASSMAGLFDCAYRWEAVHLLKMRNPVSARMALGTAVHKSTAEFDSARMRGNPIKPDDAAGVLVDHLKNPGEFVMWNSDDITKREAETIGLTLHSKYCTHLSPQYTFAAVELDLGSLDIEVPEQGVSVRITGTLDRSRARTSARGIGITDLKTGQRAVRKIKAANRYVAETKGHGIQIGVYEILAARKLERPITEPAEIIGLGTTAQTPIASSTIATARTQVLGNINSPSLIEMAARMLRTGHFPPNPQSRVCGPKYCPRWSTCPYHE